MGSQQSKTQKSNKVTFESQPDDWPWVWALSDGSILDWKNEYLQCNEDDVDASIRAQAEKQQILPVKISDTLYLGNAASVQNVTKLVEQLGITAVLNMAGPFAIPNKTIRAMKEKGM